MIFSAFSFQFIVLHALNSDMLHLYHVISEQSRYFFLFASFLMYEYEDEWIQSWMNTAIRIEVDPDIQMARGSHRPFGSGLTRDGSRGRAGSWAVSPSSFPCGGDFRSEIAGLEAEFTLFPFLPFDPRAEGWRTANGGFGGAGNGPGRWEAERRHRTGGGGAVPEDGAGGRRAAAASARPFPSPRDDFRRTGARRVPRFQWAATPSDWAGSMGGPFRATWTGHPLGGGLGRQRGRRRGAARRAGFMGDREGRACAARAIIDPPPHRPPPPPITSSIIIRRRRLLPSTVAAVVQALSPATASIQPSSFPAIVRPVAAAAAATARFPTLRPFRRTRRLPSLRPHVRAFPPHFLLQIRIKAVEIVNRRTLPVWFSPTGPPYPVRAKLPAGPNHFGPSGPLNDRAMVNDVGHRSTPSSLFTTGGGGGGACAAPSTNHPVWWWLGYP